MINGHGDDIYRYRDIRANFSSNVYAHFNHAGLFRHLSEKLPHVVCYPEPSPDSLEAALARHHGIRPEEVMATNGATEAIYLIARAYRHLRMVIPQPTFSEYADACRQAGATCLTAAAGPADDLMTWLCNPNNPTGDVRSVATLPEGKLVLDASYAAYTAKPLLTAVEAVRRKDMLMLRSMTKDYGIPGIRLGYVVGAEEMLRPLKALRMPWSIGTIALHAGCYLLRHHEEYRIPLDLLISERQHLAVAFGRLGIQTFPSDSNILLCLLPHGTATALKEQLATRHGILIRDASNFEGLTPRHFRIAAQTPEENDLLIAAITSAL